MKLRDVLSVFQLTLFNPGKVLKSFDQIVAVATDVFQIASKECGIRALQLEILICDFFKAVLNASRFGECACDLEAIRFSKSGEQANVFHGHGNLKSVRQVLQFSGQVECVTRSHWVVPNLFERVLKVMQCGHCKTIELFIDQPDKCPSHQLSFSVSLPRLSSRQPESNESGANCAKCCYPGRCRLIELHPEFGNRHYFPWGVLYEPHYLNLEALS